MSWLEMDHRGVANYSEAEALWSRVRSKAKGKPITGWLRMFKQDNGNFLFKIVNYGEQNLCELTPDNKLRFVMPSESWRGNAQTLVTSMHRWLPFTTVRHRTGLYRIAGSKSVIAEMTERHQANPDESDPYRSHLWSMYQYYNPIMREKAYYFGGIEFDMIDGTCLNPQPDVKLVEKPEERKKWRRALGAFKKGIKARVRVHAFDGIIDEVWEERNQGSRWDWEQPQWDSKQWLDKLEHCIRDNVFPPELLKGLAQTTPNGYYRSSKPDGEDVLKALDYVCNNQSIALRQRFGVFETEE